MWQWMLGLSGTGRWWLCSRVVYVHIWEVMLWRRLYTQIIKHTTVASCGDSHPGLFRYVRHKRLNWCGRDLGGAFMLGTSAFPSQCKAQPITMTHIFNVLAIAFHVIPSHRIGWGVDNTSPDRTAPEDRMYKVSRRLIVEGTRGDGNTGNAQWNVSWFLSVDDVIRNGEANITRWPQRAQGHSCPTFEPYATVPCQGNPRACIFRILNLCLYTPR